MFLLLFLLLVDDFGCRPAIGWVCPFADALSVTDCKFFGHDR
jgi:hypothetical protein